MGRGKGGVGGGVAFRDRCRPTSAEAAGPHAKNEAALFPLLSVIVVVR